MAYLIYNRVTLAGRLTADPEVKMTTGGTEVCNFSIAVGRKRTVEGEKDVDFFNCIAWRGLAEMVCKYFRKGDPILVDGELRNRFYTDKAGCKRYLTEVLCSDVTFIESKKDKEERLAASAPQEAPKEAPKEEQMQFGDVIEGSAPDDLPF